MKIESYLLTGMLGLALMAAKPGTSATLPDTTGGPPQMVITLLKGAGGSRPDNLAQGEITVTMGKTPAPVVRLQKLAGALADMQLFVLLDDSTRSGSLGVHLGELKSFLNSLPTTTQVAVGYMRNGTFALSQDFTPDHEKAAAALRLPMAMPGANGSPYFVLSDLVKRWPSTQATPRRAVLMLTDGVDRYYGSADLDDPYEDAAIHGALKRGVMVYSIYLTGAGAYDRRGGVRLFGQSRLIEASEETGGYAYFLDSRDPVTIAPYLDDLRDRLDHQYQVILGAVNEKGIRPVKLRTESPGLKIAAPTRIFVP
jgi:hypothetical protein